MTEYYPARIYRNGHINTVAASSILRKLYTQRISQSFRKRSKSVILELANNIRLQGWLSSCPNNQEVNRPLVTIIHGWLGCADSVYLLPIANKLAQLGFRIFRLNLRDHGGTQHLNKELFHSCRLQEVLDAIKKIQSQVPHSKSYLIGYSLGGNFALRIGAHAENQNLKIAKIFSICPVMNPENALNKTHSMLKIYTDYYLRRWKQMLKYKYHLYPDDFDLQVINQQQTLTGMTEHLLLQYTDFSTLQSYLNGYSITGDRLKDLTVPSEVFISKDDPVIPYIDYKNLHSTKYLNIHLNDHGGHCGYLNGLFAMSWIDEQIIQQLSK